MARALVILVEVDVLKREDSSEEMMLERVHCDYWI